MAEPLTDKELAEFRRRVDGLHDMSLGTSMRVGWERRILATIADLRDQLQQAQGERDRAVNELVAEVGKGREWDEKYDAAIERGWGACMWVFTLALSVRDWKRKAHEIDATGTRLLDEAIKRAEAAEALAGWSGKALVLAYANMGQENWARMTDRAKNTIINNVQLAEAQGRQAR